MPLRKDELNTLKLLKGQIDTNRFPIWDTVKECDDSCELVNECTFDKQARNGEVLRCKLQVHFLRTMLDITLTNLPEKNKTEYHLQKIGLTLLPLYKQLITMQMLEQSIIDPMLGEGAKAKIHPVYKEIRIITKDIDNCLISLGINRAVSEGGLLPDPEDLVSGDTSYYENMQADHEDSSHSFVKKNGSVSDKPIKKKKKKK